LCRATSNKKLRETVSLELSFVNSNLQLLKEQLAVLNSSVEVYQGDQHGGLTHHIPMIPLGLKETKEVPFHDALHVRVFSMGSTLLLLLLSLSPLDAEWPIVNGFNLGLFLCQQEFIEDHYKGKADEYLEAIAELSDLRQVRKKPN
jgi:hypothetical protein